MYNDIKVSTDKDLDKGKITSIDFDIIKHDNAIMYKYFDKSLGYIDQEIYGDKIHSGITKDKDRYFFFEHSIINKPSLIFISNDKSWHSIVWNRFSQEINNTNYKKLNKGSDKLKLSEETKKKLSESLKNRVFTLEHREKLRKCISYEDFEIIVVDLVNSGVISTITAYRKYAKDNPELKYPIKPEKSYKNCGWSGWRKYGL